MTFYYTDAQTFSSSVLAEAFFDSEDNSVAVVLNSDDIYTYPHFTQDEWDAFVRAPSAGSHWNRLIKGRTGGAYRGDIDYVDFEKREGFAAPRHLTTESDSGLLRLRDLEPVTDTNGFTTVEGGDRGAVNTEAPVQNTQATETFTVSFADDEFETEVEATSFRDAAEQVQAALRFLSLDEVYGTRVNVEVSFD